MTDFAIVLMNGIFYCPANKHYPHIPNTPVNCDRCKKTNVSVCVGYGNFDLCMKCVEEVAAMIQLQQVPTFIVPKIIEPLHPVNTQVNPVVDKPIDHFADINPITTTTTTTTTVQRMPRQLIEKPAMRQAMFNLNDQGKERMPREMIAAPSMRQAMFNINDESNKFCQPNPQLFQHQPRMTTGMMQSMFNQPNPFDTNRPPKKHDSNVFDLVNLFGNKS
jgi:hypothetical protein